MGKQTKRRWQLPQLTTKAKIIFGLVLFLFAAALTVYIVTSLMARQAIDDKGYDIGQIRKDLAAKTAEQRRDDTASMVYAAQAAGDSKKAGDIYMQSIEVETDPTHKVELAIDRADQLFKAKQTAAALAILKEAEAYSDDKYLIAHQLGLFYTLNKQYDKAGEYYLLAGSLVDSPTNVAEYPKAYYDEKAAQLKQLEAGKG